MIKVNFRTTIITFIVLFFLIAVVGILFVRPLLDRLEEKEYKRLFMMIPEVSSVEDFFSYEDYRRAVLNLKDGTSISLGGIDRSSFTKTSYLGLHKIDDVMVHCRNNYGGGSNSFNIVEVFRIFAVKPEINNVGELVKNHKFVYQFIEKNFPQGQTNHRKIRLGGETYFCSYLKDPIV